MNVSYEPAAIAARVIYDIGANNGDDIPYYLLKAEKVVAVEANPVLAQAIGQRFEAEIFSGRLVVENSVVTAEGKNSKVPFYVNRECHLQSQLTRPRTEVTARFDEVLLPARGIVSLIDQHGNPYYLKSDIEGYDGAIISALFNAGIRPPFISAESHSIDVFCAMVAIGGYSAFKLVDGASVPTTYKNVSIETLQGSIRHSFPPHAAGPFGDDIAGPWYPPNSFSRLLGLEGMGWKDVHATNAREATPDAYPRFGKYVLRAALGRIKRTLRFKE